MSARRPHALWWIAATAAVFVADLFLHLPITDFCETLAKRYGFIEYDYTTRLAFAALGACVLIAAWAWPSGRRVAIGTATTALLALVVVFQKLIIVTAAENTHYPQYALLAYLLVVAAGLPPPREATADRRSLGEGGQARGSAGLKPGGYGNAESAWLIAVGLGVLDEAYQLVALPRAGPGYFDWNDVLLNGVGAAFGIVIAIALSRASLVNARFSSRTVAATIVMVTAIALLVGPPVFSPFFSSTPGGRQFHVVSMTETVVILAAVWAGLRALLLTPIRSGR